MLRLVLYTTLCAAFGIVTPTAGSAQEIVAAVDDDSIATKDFARSYTRYLLKTGVHDSARFRSLYLDGLIAERLLVADGRDIGLDRTPLYAQYSQQVREKLFIDSYLEEHVTSGVVVTEADLEEAFMRMNTELTARHLYARTEDEAAMLRARLESGETFDALAAEIFGDSTLARSGGSLGTFTYDEMDQDFEDAAYELELGDVSDPVRTAFGYSIIQVTDRYTKPIITEYEFAQKKAKLRAFVLRNKRIHARTQFARSVADGLDVSFHPAFDRLLGQIRGYDLLSDEELTAFLDEPLITFSDDDVTTWTVAQFRRLAANTDADQRSQVRSAADLEDFVTGVVVRGIILDRARAEGHDQRDAYRKALASALDAWVLKQRRELVAAAVTVPQDSIRAQYERYPGDFLAPDGTRRTLDEVRQVIIDELQQTYSKQSEKNLVASLRERAYVHINRDALRSLRITGSAPAARGRSATPVRVGSSAPPVPSSTSMNDGGR